MFVIVNNESAPRAIGIDDWELAVVQGMRCRVYGREDVDWMTFIRDLFNGPISICKYTKKILCSAERQ